MSTQQLDWASLPSETIVISRAKINPDFVKAFSHPWINYEVPLIEAKPKLEVEVWHQCPACRKDFVTTFKNPTQRDFDNISEHLNKDIPLCQECGSYYDE